MLRITIDITEYGEDSELVNVPPPDPVFDEIVARTTHIHGNTVKPEVTTLTEALPDAEPVIEAEAVDSASEPKPKTATVWTELELVIGSQDPRWRFKKRRMMENMPSEADPESLETQLKSLCFVYRPIWQAIDRKLTGLHCIPARSDQNDKLWLDQDAFADSSDTAFAIAVNQAMCASVEEYFKRVGGQAESLDLVASMNANALFSQKAREALFSWC